MDWQPIETAPKDDSDFYALCDYRLGGCTYGIARRGKTGRIYAYDSFGEDFDPTHWMPLPEPPK